jgi:hypothetical protein
LPITIIVDEIERKGRFSAELPDGTVLAASSRQPLLDAARVLLRQGYDPNQRLAMKRRGSDTVALSGVLGKLAKLMVEETDRGGLRVRKFRLHPRATPPAATGGATADALDEDAS